MSCTGILFLGEISDSNTPGRPTGPSIGASPTIQSTTAMLRTITRSAARPVARGFRFNSTATHKVTTVKDLAQFNETINKKPVAIVDFYAVWCGPCRAIKPFFEALSAKVPDVEFARVDVDEAEDVAREYGITAMPTILYFENGEKVDTVVGADVGKIVSTLLKYTKIES